MAWLANDYARLAGEYHLQTGRDIRDLPADMLYNVAVALFSRDAAMPANALESIDASLDSLGPPKSERTGGMNSYDPDLEIEGWGTADLPDLAMLYGPADGSVSPRPATMDGED